MTDVRSMLRAERESRRITHPHASYTSTGNLLCNICELPIKSERAWSSHLHSTQHNLRLGRERDAAQLRGKEDSNPSKKRKAVAFEEPPLTERKKARPADESNVLPDRGVVVDNKDGNEAQSASASVDGVADQHTTTITTTTTTTADELLAFERDLAALEQQAMQDGTIGSTTSAMAAPATISAPAITAQEIAAQAREEQSKQRDRRQEEIADEREDAARALEDEFAEMDNLQERVKKLRDRREALRNHSGVESHEITIKAKEPMTDGDSIVDTSTFTVESSSHANESEDDDDDDEEEDWNFGIR